MHVLFKEDLFYFYLCLAAPVLICYMQDLRSSWQHEGSLVVAFELSVATCGDPVP